MRDEFPGHYRPTEEEFQAMWKECLFAFDANVLLNFYRYSDKTRKALFDVLGMVADRIWIPYQVAYEYQENRLGVVRQQRQVYTELVGILNEARKSLKTKLDALKSHPILQPKVVLKRVNKSLQDVEVYLRSRESAHPTFTDNDPLSGDEIRVQLTELFRDKVGPPYSIEELSTIRKDGESRLTGKVPPGFIDYNRKEGDQRFGDLVLWRQLVDKAKQEKRPIIFVTDERKEDWWWLDDDGKTLGPRPELVEEMMRDAGISFYMYRPERFMEFARTYLEQEVSAEAITEVEEVGRQPEVVFRELADLVAKQQRYDDLRNQEIHLNEMLRDAIDRNDLEQIPGYYRELEDVRNQIALVGLTPRRRIRRRADSVVAEDNVTRSLFELLGSRKSSQLLGELLEDEYDHRADAAEDEPEKPTNEIEDRD